MLHMSARVWYMFIALCVVCAPVFVYVIFVYSVCALHVVNV